VPELQRLRADHADAVLAFERQNRAWFARSISDRGDDFFERYAEKHAARLAEQERGEGAYFVLVDEDGSVLGRFNLVLDEPGRAELGYRMAEQATGRGLATRSVREVCGLAGSTYGAREVVAATSRRNLASQRVLQKAGFVVTGPADPGDIGGQEGSWWRLEVSAG
jgi:ribosomal-protein-alanine N-acetyltransferase